MHNKLLKILLSSAILPILFACTTHATPTTTTHSKENTPSDINLGTEAFLGRWSINCENAKGIIVTEMGNILMEVNNNQIYITALGHKKEKILTIFLDEPEDLGRGGMMLDWQNFSKENPIADLKLETKNSAQLTWYGFFNKIQKAHEWADKPDFVVKQNPVILEKCS